MYLAQQLGGEIIGCDSVQVYSGVSVGSAKVPPTERQGIPHHLIDVATPDEKFTAGDYARVARRVISEVNDRARVPVVVGGTGLYLRALIDGLSPAPPRDEAFRGRLDRATARHPAVLHRYLRRFDHPSAERIHPNDKQKMTRAVEICHLSRVPASAVHRVAREALSGVRPFKLGLNPDRGFLYQKLNNRVNWMFENGLLEETKSLLDSYEGRELDVMESLGYSQAVKCLKGELSVADAVAECQTKTRNYAKRQMTWFRSESDISWINDFGSEHKTKDMALQLATNFLVLFRKS